MHVVPNRCSLPLPGAAKIPAVREEASQHERASHLRRLDWDYVPKYAKEDFQSIGIRTRR